jgi:N-acetyltransferase 10
MAVNLFRIGVITYFLIFCITVTIIVTLQNSPNDLQMLSDAPAHHLFCLLGPVDPIKKSLPEVLAVVQVSDDIIYFN